MYVLISAHTLLNAWLAIFPCLFLHMNSSRWRANWAELTPIIRLNFVFTRFQ